jgi:predicted amidophosphoribosyltransferase
MCAECEKNLGTRICPKCGKPFATTSRILLGGYYNKYLKYSNKLNKY